MKIVNISILSIGLLHSSFDNNLVTSITLDKKVHLKDEKDDKGVVESLGQADMVLQEMKQQVEKLTEKKRINKE